MKDILEHCEICYRKLPNHIKILAEVFGDIEEINVDELSSDEEDLLDTATDMIWYGMKLKMTQPCYSLFDSQVLAEEESESQSTWINQTCQLVTTPHCSSGTCGRGE